MRHIWLFKDMDTLFNILYMYVNDYLPLHHYSDMFLDMEFAFLALIFRNGDSLSDKIWSSDSLCITKVAKFK